MAEALIGSQNWLCVITFLVGLRTTMEDDTELFESYKKMNTTFFI